MDANQAYDFLRTQGRETALLASSAAVLHWDQRTYIPAKGHGHRAEQLAFLSGLVHDRVTDPERGKALDILEQSGTIPLDPPGNDPELATKAANLREWRREYDRVVKVPKDLAVDLARATSLAETAWEKARPANDWEEFRPHLEKVLKLRQQEADCIGYATEPYDALLDEYEPGETAASLAPVFTVLKTRLADLVKRIQNSDVKPDPAILAGPFEVETQRAFATDVITAMGYDFQAGRMDVTAHPFSIGIGPGDSRITTRFSESKFDEALTGAMHEAGHAMYEMGLPAEHWGGPRGEAVSLGLHESQSRLWENMVGRSRAFWEFFLPRAQERFAALKGAALDDFVLALNRVEPSLIRVDADEVTYNLHVALRFELELDLLRGDLAVKDLPEAWNAKTEELLGITPPDFADGVMQDVHWSAGLIGYFPTYSLGNMYAAQLFHAAKTELGDLDALFSRGEFSPLLDWLRKKVHSQGMLHRPRDLMKLATGEDLNPDRLLGYLENKYANLYSL